jgi:hypothetical protein
MSPQYWFAFHVCALPIRTLFELHLFFAAACVLDVKGSTHLKVYIVLTLSSSE